MFSSRSWSIATQPMPPSLIAIFRSGWRTGYPDHSHSAHAASEICPKSVAASGTMGASAGIAATPLDPTWRQITVSVSAHASMIGSHQPEKIDGRSIRWGCSGSVTARNPRAALRRISSAPRSGSPRNVMPIGTKRSGCAPYHSSKNQSFHAG